MTGLFQEMIPLHKKRKRQGIITEISDIVAE